MKKRFIVCELVTEELPLDRNFEVLKEWKTFDTELEALQLIKNHFDLEPNSTVRFTIINTFEKK